MLRRLSFRVKLLAGFGVLVLGAGSLLVYQINHREPPSFRRGGVFADGAQPDPAGETTTTSAAAAPDSTSSSAPATTTSTAATAGTTAPKGKASTTTTGPPVPGSAAGSTATTAQPPVTAPPAQPSTPAAARAPAAGTYTYAVEGQEKPSFFSARRFPERMTTVVHGGPGLSADQLVFDLHYSDEHEEREIVGFRDDGIYFDFEGGSVTFGPRTETNEGDYVPPLLQIPRRLEAGFTSSGTSQVKRSDGSVSRTEDWTVKVVGKEALTVAGATVETWKVETNRKSRPGGSEINSRQRTYWYDPGRAMWVRFVDVLHGERTQGITFTYDSTVTANLLSFTPS
ncbi:MAG TPA: hypothetical protein VGL92_06920 [Acidimicrobiia bacterium]